ncbi:LCP family protein [Staphylococcus equorum]|uniref:LytR family transcriptional regulator n=2 Tax=Staphylococcus equorum TaxID=246432 RepID=A0AAP7IEY6_9STAP|nr:LCP family protein [Staphylococcus equorum]ALM56801.1 transcriptional regulator [Staphylococcus equorum]MDK9859295.1 LCP family protein [Staphylococcus equorum]OEK56604.1 LytR family transcriptional regulator [Staphylococcus equorum]OEK58296.1 LytR family transcriptional regulator [Staphylococcus equorum]OEK63610.1 LytR family transcriptional regulator [Staphylococcus equorum]
MKMRSKLILIVLFILIVLSLFSLYKISEFKNSIHQTKDGSEVTSKIQKQAKNNEPISIALFGVDSNKERAKENTGQRTDTIILASIDPKDNKTKLLTIPRDTRSKISSNSNYEKISHAYAYGGPETAMNTIENNFDVPIDAYATVDMDGFEETVDTLGGLTIESNATFQYNGSEFETGETTKLDGKSALDYVRSRKQLGSGGDEGRTERQRQVIEALAKESDNKSNILKINNFMDIIENNMKTDLSLNDIKSIYTNYKSASKNVDKLSIQGNNMIGADGLWYFEPNIQDKKQTVQEYNDNLK